MREKKKTLDTIEEKIKFKKVTNKQRLQEKGITIIALVVTIIILIILAGITLSELTGDGLFTKTLEAREKNQKAEATEIINLKITNMEIDSYAKTQQMPTLQYLANGFCDDNDMQYVELQSKKQATLTHIDASNAESIFVKLKKYPYEFEINSKLQLASIDGVKITEVADNSQDLIEIQSQLNMLKQEVDSLKSSNQQLSEKNEELVQNLNKTNERIDNIITDLNVSTRKALFEGKARRYSENLYTK